MSSATSAISSSSAVSHELQPAQTSALKRSLSNLGAAIQKGELVPASSILSAFFKANPQYTSTNSDSSQSQDPVIQAFQNLATAISNNQIDVAQTAWTQIKSDLANLGVTNLGDGTTSTPGVPSQTKTSGGEQIASDAFGIHSGGDASITVLLAGSSASTSQTGLSNSLIGNWVTYQPSGTTAPAETISSTGHLLNTAV